MKLWLLDADAIIDLLSFGLFDTLIERHEVYAASTVIDEVKSYRQGNEKIRINFREIYVESGRIKEREAVSSELDEVLSKFPAIWKQTLHAGEIESLAILIKEESLILCSCDAATIRALPFLDASERGISVEKLIQLSGLTKAALDIKHTEVYFQNNLNIGKERWIQDFKG